MKTKHSSQFLTRQVRELPGQGGASVCGFWREVILRLPAIHGEGGGVGEQFKISLINLVHATAAHGKKHSPPEATRPL